MKDTSGKDLGILANGFWMILVSGIGKMGHGLVCYGVMELVSHSSLGTRWQVTCL